MTHDIRNERTEQAILNAFLSELAHTQFKDIAVASVAQAAGISRSTFYAHFSNMREVFDRAMTEFVSNIRELNVQLRCAACGNDSPDIESKVPFCIALRSAGKYESLVRSPEFLPAYLDLAEISEKNAIIEELENAGVQPNTARNVMRFQLSGCYSVAMSTSADSDWRKSQAALDTYIGGGLAALRAFAKDTRLRTGIQH